MDIERLQQLWTGPPARFKDGRQLLRLVSRASQDFGLIAPNDRILIAVSGGKDSFTLAWALMHIKRQVPFHFEIAAINLDPGFGGFVQQPILDCLRAMGLETHGSVENFGPICDIKIGDTGEPCWLCARMRRGALYNHARRLNCNKLALGHHADDMIETLMINQLFAGQMKGMPPWLINDEGDIEVIRPMAYVWEAMIVEFACKMAFPVTGCNCPNDSGSTDGRRMEIKRLLAELEGRVPDLKQHLLASMTRVKPSHLMDRKLFTFGAPQNPESKPPKDPPHE